MTKAVIVFSMGGPAGSSDVYPFLYRLFQDKAIMRIPAPFRQILARVLARRRTPEAQKIYALMGGGSPILAQTQAQANALARALGASYHCFVGMSYSAPFIKEAVCAALKENPDELIMLPLYPQYSTTTTASGFAAIEKEIKKQKSTVRIKQICSYQTNDGFIEALCEMARPVITEAETYGAPCILLSAHGLPVHIVKAGDPYPQQCAQTAQASCQKLACEGTLCFQSRVGPLAWIKPATDDEIRCAAQAKRPIVVIPIAFVSEHAETLVELEQTYRVMAKAEGCPFFGVAPTVQTHPRFIEGLAQLVRTC